MDIACELMGGQPQPFHSNVLTRFPVSAGPFLQSAGYLERGEARIQSAV